MQDDQDSSVTRWAQNRVQCSEFGEKVRQETSSVAYAIRALPDLCGGIVSDRSAVLFFAASASSPLI